MPISSGIMFLMYRFGRLVALVYIRKPCGIGPGQSEGPEPCQPGGLRPIIEAGEPSTGPFRDRDIGCACPTGDSYGRTTDDPAQHLKGAKIRPRKVRWGTSAAKGSIKAGAP
jgi:hypothetical protein